jgi:hypothetical protein
MDTRSTGNFYLPVSGFTSMKKDIHWNFRKPTTATILKIGE